MGRLVQLTSLIMTIAVITSLVNAQTIYLNSYALDERSISNFIYKVNIESQSIEDSLFLPTNGSFCMKKPIIVDYSNSSYILSFWVNGLYAKNSQLGIHTTSHYCAVDMETFDMVNCDSLLDVMVGDKYSYDNDTLIVELYEENTGVWEESKLLFDRDNRLIEQSSRNLTRQDLESIMVGNYVEPDIIFSQDTISYYWGYEDVGENSYVNLLAVIDSDIIFEKRIADRVSANIIVGFNSETNMIYAFILPFKLLSYNPIEQSPENITPEILVISPDNFEIVQTLNIDMGDIYLGRETGNCSSFDSYLYYYFFLQDGVGRYDPAYLLIFNTRTNEASWLRVGWR